MPKKLNLFIALLAIMLTTTWLVAAQEDGLSSLPDPVSDDPVERGEYLFRIQFICIACHLGPDAEGNMPENPLVADPSGGELFELPTGSVYSRNLTQIGDWTAEELEIAIRFGISADGDVLLPIMAFSLYESINDQDMVDLIAYLQSLEPIEHDIPPAEFLIAGMSREDFRFEGEIDLDKERPVDDSGDPVERGAYLANVAACMHCHGQVGEDLIAVPYPDGLPWGWIAPPLLSYHIGAVYSSSEEIRASIASGVRPNGNAIDPTMPWQIFGLWRDEDIDAIVAWIESLPDDLEPADHPFPFIG